jgi:hypothetical protein
LLTLLKNNGFESRGNGVYEKSIIKGNEMGSFDLLKHGEGNIASSADKKGR